MKAAYERMRGEGFGADAAAPAGADDGDADGFHGRDAPLRWVAGITASRLRPDNSEFAMLGMPDRYGKGGPRT
jgi:hypothetical protein